MPNPDPLRAALVLPTYNERENLAAMVAAIQALPTPIHIIVVDDNSPDGTGAIADALAAQSSSVEVIHRSGKLGLGTAYAAGFRPGDRGGKRPHPDHGCRFLARSQVSACHPGSQPALRSGDRLTLRARGRRPRLAVAPPGLELGRQHDRPSAVGPARAGLHGGLPLLPAASVGDGRSVRYPGQRLLLPDRNALLLRARRVHRRRGADHLCRPAARTIQDLAE